MVYESHQEYKRHLFDTAELIFLVYALFALFPSSRFPW